MDSVYREKFSNAISFTIFLSLAFSYFVFLVFGLIFFASLALCVQAAEKKWEEKQQSMCHYDGWEFEKMLQEAEANMLRGIPTMEMGVEGSTMPGPAAAPPSATEEHVEKVKLPAPPAQGQGSSSTYFSLAVLQSS